MRVIEAGKLDAVNLLPHERCFLECWYSMTHMRSLDSYRVRCMNSRTIARELSDELHIGLIDDQDLAALCSEVKATLDADPILQQHFHSTTTITLPFLTEPPSLKEKKSDKDKKEEAARRDRLREFTFAVEDLHVALERDYFHWLCDALPKAIKPDNEAEIFSITGSLLSDLVDRGWTLESLFLWHRHFLREDLQGKYTFLQNLDFMLEQLNRPAQSFTVTRAWSSARP